jgi:hypothetical protein
VHRRGGARRITAREASARTAGVPASASITASGVPARTVGAPASASMTGAGAGGMTEGHQRKVGAKCNTRSTKGGEKEASWHHKGHVSSIITHAFFITRGRYQMGGTQKVHSVGLISARTNKRHHHHHLPA